MWNDKCLDRILWLSYKIIFADAIFGYPGILDIFWLAYIQVLGILLHKWNKNRFKKIWSFVFNTIQAMAQPDRKFKFLILLISVVFSCCQLYQDAQEQKCVVINIIIALSLYEAKCVVFWWLMQSGEFFVWNQNPCCIKTCSQTATHCIGLVGWWSN